MPEYSSAMRPQTAPEPSTLHGSWSGLQTNISLPPLQTRKTLKSVFKYTPAEWNTSNILNVSTGEKERSTAERLRDECARLRTETHLRTERTQMDVNKKLEHRIYDINFWKAELEREHGEVVAEIKSLQAFIGRLERALAATEKPLSTARQCLSYRDRRVRIDLVHDNVEATLNKEVEVLESIRTLLANTIERALNQLWLLRSAKTMLEKDLGDKMTSLSLDNKCGTLSNYSKDIHYAPASVVIQQSSTTPDEWEGFSCDNIAKAERERKASVALRSEINGILMQSFVDLRNIYDSVNNEFNKRIEETIDAKRKLEKEYAKVCDEIASMQNNIDSLKAAIEAKEAPMKVAQTRLDKRARRPNVELCRDPVQYRLVGEVGEIYTTIDRLRQRLAESQATLEALLRKKENLEDDIEVKTNSLFIDRDQCMVIRRQVRHLSH